MNVPNVTIDGQGHTVTGFSLINFNQTTLPSQTVLKNMTFAGSVTIDPTGYASCVCIAGDNSSSNANGPSFILQNVTVQPVSVTGFDTSCLSMIGNNILIDHCTITGQIFGGPNGTDDPITMSTYPGLPPGAGGIYGSSTNADLYWVTIQNTTASNGWDSGMEWLAQHLHSCSFLSNTINNITGGNSEGFYSQYSVYPAGLTQDPQPPINCTWTNNALHGVTNHMYRFTGGTSFADNDTQAIANWGSGGNVFTGNTST